MTNINDVKKCREELDLVIREYEEDIKYHPRETLSTVWRKRIPKLKTALLIIDRYIKWVTTDIGEKK